MKSKGPAYAQGLAALLRAGGDANLRGVTGCTPLHSAAAAARPSAARRLLARRPRLRQGAGPDVPIICTIDPHANLSVRMVEACNATVASRSSSTGADWTAAAFSCGY